jgi:hypothetical protein
MTVTVNFKINEITKQLDVSLLKDDSTPQEECLAKRILSMSTQLNFVNLPMSHGIDVGSSIEVSEERYDDEGEEFYNYEEDEQDDESEIDEVSSDSDVEVNVSEKTIDDVIDIVKEEEVRRIENIQQNVDCDKTQKEIEDIVSSGQSLRWAEGEQYVDIKLNVEEASKIIGGLTTPSSIATMMIYELVKKTIHKVEKYV